MAIHVPLILRNIVLRLLLISALSGLITGILNISFLQLNPLFSPVATLDWVKSIVLPIIVILHHTMRLWPRKYWLVICEVLFSVMEVVTTGYFLAPVLPRDIQEIIAGINFANGFSLGMAHAVSLFVTVVFSFILLVFLICDILNDRGKSFLHPYDFSAGLCSTGRQWSFVGGIFVTRKRFSTDNRFIQSIRAVLAILSLFAISALVIYALILQPIELRGKQGVKISKISVINGNIESALLTAIGQALPGFFLPFQAVLTVANKSTSYPTVTLKGLVEHATTVEYCQSNAISSGTVLANCSVAYFPLSGLDDQLEIFVTTNFPEMSDGNQLYLGMTLSTGDILAGAEPIDIVPGANLRGLGSFLVKEQILNQQAATFGIPQYRRFAVMNVGSLSADLSPSLSRDNNTATLRILVRSQPYIGIEQDYIENSVLNGFALVGGVWTLLNGVFAAIFGSTLLLVLFGIKPLSIYGLIHFFRPGRGSLADGGYTLSSEERDRIVGILREHLLDVEGAEGNGASSSHYSLVDVPPQSAYSHGGGGVQA